MEAADESGEPSGGRPSSAKVQVAHGDGTVSLVSMGTTWRDKRGEGTTRQNEGVIKKWRASFQ